MVSMSQFKSKIISTEVTIKHNGFVVFTAKFFRIQIWRTLVKSQTWM